MSRPTEATPGGGAEISGNHRHRTSVWNALGKGIRDLVLGLIAFMAVTTTALSTIMGVLIFVFYGLITAQPNHH
jgi:hypothetical protein